MNLTLSKMEFLNAVIEDYRDNLQQPTKFMFQVEHATNFLPDNYEWSENDQLNFIDTHWAMDIGALDLARKLAQQFKSILVYSKYSRLFIDVNRTITCNNLFRKMGDSKEIDLNKNLSFQEESTRIQYHSSYYHTLKFAIEQYQPQVFYSIHSFTNMYEGKERKIEMGILCSQDGKFQQDHVRILCDKGYDCRFNEPWTGADYYGFGLDSSRHYNQNDIKQGICFEVRNDLLQNSQSFQKIKDTIVDTIQKINGL